LSGTRDDLAQGGPPVPGEFRTGAHRAHAAAASGFRGHHAGPARPSELPEINLNHLLALSDDTGLLQHAVFTVPNYSAGYTTDDNA